MEHKPLPVGVENFSDLIRERIHFEEFYDRRVSLIRSVFESALKTNDSLAFAVITGCLRISRESIFTGLNNLQIISITDSVLPLVH